MHHYLSIDAGGSKCAAILFNDHFECVGEGQSGGVNTNFCSMDDCRRNVAACLGDALRGHEGIHLPEVWVTFIGPIEVLREELARLATVDEVHMLDEGRSGVLAGMLAPHGLLALSGTGSDVFYVGEGRYAVVGGWGSLLGDQGSGVWIAQRALQAAIQGHLGWGRGTSVMQGVVDAWSLRKPWHIVDRIHSSPAPFREMASLLPVIADAARAGDEVALEAFEEAGRMMARQLTCLLQREDVPAEDMRCVCCGGAWKAHPAMYEAFVAESAALCPQVAIQKPYFEQVMMGAAACLLKRRPELDTDSARALLAGAFPKHVIHW